MTKMQAYLIFFYLKCVKEISNEHDIKNNVSMWVRVNLCNYALPTC